MIYRNSLPPSLYELVPFAFDHPDRNRNIRERNLLAFGRFADPGLFSSLRPCCVTFGDIGGLGVALVKEEAIAKGNV